MGSGNVGDEHLGIVFFSIDRLNIWSILIIMLKGLVTDNITIIIKNKLK